MEINMLLTAGCRGTLEGSHQSSVRTVWIIDRGGDVPAARYRLSWQGVTVQND